MKKIKLKINHKDGRGMISDLLNNKKINSITLITQRKGKIRTFLSNKGYNQVKKYENKNV